jgi:methylglyoxal synthase
VFVSCEWLSSRRRDFFAVDLLVTHSTGADIASKAGVPVKFLPAPPLGDEVARRRIEDGCVDLVLVFWYWQSPRRYELDVDGVLRLAFRCDVPVVLHPWTADFFFTTLLKGMDKIRKGSTGCSFPIGQEG